MGLSKEQIIKIEDVLKRALKHKFENYMPEPAAMPFHTRLLGKDRLALYAFIHSLNTNFGTSIFEPVALSIAESTFYKTKLQYCVGDEISEAAHKIIQEIIDSLNTATDDPDKEKEIEAIRKVCQMKPLKKVKPTKVDIMLENKQGELFLIDIKTAKPNRGAFKEFKRTLLEWAAIALNNNPKAKINTLIAIPYNPYEPNPYSRWTFKGMLDIDCELKVASEFWDFLGGDGTYQDLLDCFERVGVALRSDIDNYFAKYNKKL